MLGDEEKARQGDDMHRKCTLANIHSYSVKLGILAKILKR